MPMPSRSSDDERTPSQTVEVETIGGIAVRGYPADRVELMHYYRQNVCPTTCESVLSIMSDRELRRLVFIGTYSEQYGTTKNRGRVVKRISAAVGINWSTGFRYAKQFDRTRVQQVK